MAEGQGRYLATKQAAIEEVRQLQAGDRQHRRWLHAGKSILPPDAFLSLEQAFDPVANVAYAGRFLRSLFADSGAWDEAAGRYHSATPGLKDPYRDKVVQIWQREQRMELAGSTTFGSGSLTAGADRASQAPRQARSPLARAAAVDGRQSNGRDQKSSSRSKRSGRHADDLLTETQRSDRRRRYAGLLSSVGQQSSARCRQGLPHSRRGSGVRVAASAVSPGVA